MSSYISLPMFGGSLGQRVRLEAARCGACDTLIYPQRPQCPNCGGTDLATEPLSGEGSLYTFTVIARGGAPAEFDDQQTMTGTIVVGVVELREGPRIIAQIAGWAGVSRARLSLQPSGRSCRCDDRFPSDGAPPRRLREGRWH